VTKKLSKFATSFQGAQDNTCNYFSRYKTNNVLFDAMLTVFCLSVTADAP